MLDIIPLREAGHDLALTSRIDQSPAAVYLASLSPGSRRCQRQALELVAGILAPGTDLLAFPWAGLRYQHVAAMRSWLGSRYAPATSNRVLSAIRGVLREAWRLGLMSDADYMQAVDFKGFRNERAPVGRALLDDEIAALLASCREDTGAAGRRDAAMLAILCATGLRRAELVGLDLEDVTADGLRVRRGKGNTQRLVPLAPGVAEAIADWVAVRGLEPGPLFWGVAKGGALGARRLSRQAVYDVVRKRSRQARLAAPISPHDFRRTAITNLLARGADITVVAGIVGHASIAGTARYDRRGEEAKRRAIALIEVPYTPRNRPPP